jgi:hypothetical protein
MTQPGWLSDPTGRFEYRYWDGSSWTAHVSRAGQTTSDPLAPPPPDQSTGAWPSSLPPIGAMPQPTTKPWTTHVAILVIAGAIALAVGSFLPWVKASAGPFTATTNGTSGDGVLTLILAGLIVLLFAVVKPRRFAAIVTTVLAVIVALITLYDTGNISSRAHDLANGTSGVSASVGVGLILAAAAAFAILIGGIIGIVETRRA